MPITPADPFKGRQYPGQLLCESWNLWEYVQLLAKRGRKDIADRTVEKLVRTCTDWSHSAVDYQKTREELARELVH